MIALRPLTLGSLLNGAFSYLRDNPKATLGVTFIIVAITSILPALGMADMSRGYARLFDTIMADPYADPEFPLSGFGLVGLYGGSLLQLLGTGLLVGLLTSVVGMAVLGHKLSFSEALQAVRGRLATLLGLTSLYFVFSVVATFLLVATAVLLFLLPLPGPILFLLVLVVCVPLAFLFLWVGIRTTLAMPVAVLERVGSFRALVRSWQLTAKSFWRLLGILLLTQIIVQIIASTLATPFTLGSMFVGLLIPDETTATVVSAVLAFIGLLLTGCISSPFTAGVTALLYLDLRMRREGLDLKLQAAAHSGEPVGPEVYLPEPRSGVPA